MISVLIPNWNGKKYLSLCLDSLEKQTFRDFETILVDNGSEDGSVEYVRENYPDVNVIEMGENKGFSAAVNAGVAAAKGELIFLFNNDAEADPGLLETFVVWAAKHPDAGFFATKVLLYYDREVLDSAGVEFFSDGRFILRGHFEKDREEFDKACNVFGGHGASVLYRTKVIRETGPFDEDFFGYMEEADINMRMNLLGYYGVYIPDALVYHVGSGTCSKMSIERKFETDDKKNEGKRTDYGKPISDFIAYHTIRNRWFLMVKSFPSDLIIRNLFSMILLEISQFIRWVVIDKRSKIYFKAFHDFRKGFGLMLKKRREIMKNRKIDSYVFLRRINRVSFFERLFGLIGRARAGKGEN